MSEEKNKRKKKSISEVRKTSKEVVEKLKSLEKNIKKLTEDPKHN